MQIPPPRFAGLRNDKALAWTNHQFQFLPTHVILPNQDSSIPIQPMETVLKNTVLKSTALNNQVIEFHGAAAAGETPAEFVRLVLENRSRIERFLFCLMGDREAAQNLTQECFLRAYKGWADFRGQSSPTTWLMTIAANLGRDQGRSGRYKFWKQLLSRSDEEYESAVAKLPTGQSSVETQLDAKRQVAVMWKRVEQLPRQQKLVFTLRFYEEMSLA